MKHDALSRDRKQKKGANISVDVYEAASKFAEIGAGVSVGAPSTSSSPRKL